MTSLVQNQAQRLLTGGLLGFALALFLAESMSAALHELHHDETFWRPLAGGGSPNVIAAYATKILFALLLAAAWWMFWKFDAFFAPSPPKASSANAEDEERETQEDHPEEKETTDDESAAQKENGPEKPPPPATPEESRFAEALGLAEDHLPEDAKAAYRTLIAQYHPDKVSRMGEEIREVAERKAKEINEAYEHFRRKYDL